MQRLFKLEPEIAGGIGDHSIIKYTNGIIKGVDFLHYEFFGWLGDELLASTPCFIVTKQLADSICKTKLEGYRFEEIYVTKSLEFVDLFPDKKLPEFIRLIPTGTVRIRDNRIISWSGDDFCLEKSVELVVTEKALNILQKHTMDLCDIFELAF